MADGGRVLAVNVSAGGVPKRPVPQARATRLGLEGDRQRDATVHGGPHRAVSLLGIEAIRRVAAEGHPIAPGTTGENLTTEGFDVSSLPPGTRLEIGKEVVLELSWPANPCRTIRHSFRDLRFGRLGAAAHPADSRMYARVIAEGLVRPGDPIRLVAPVDDAAERLRTAARLDDAERSSALSLWRAARAAGLPIEIVDEGELAMAAAPSIPGPPFNTGLGFAQLPHLVDRAVAFFRNHGTTGWIWSDREPWPGASAEAEAVSAAVDPGAVTADPKDASGVTVRELARHEVGAWSELLVEGADLDGPLADAWRALETHLALGPHDHRFVAELDGRPVGTGWLHVRHHVGWMRAGTVLPAFRGRGIQRALIAERAAVARRLGCDLLGGLAEAGGASARNLDRLGFETVAERRRYRIEAAAPSA